MAGVQDQNSIGDLGEYLAAVLLSQNTPRGFLFQTLLIGGKWPTIDLYVELLPDSTGRATDAERMFCFVQVKATTRGRLKNGNLRVRVGVSDLNKLAKSFGPTYLIGIELDELNVQKSRGCLAFVGPGMTKALPSLTTLRELQPATLVELYDEVVDFWNRTNVLSAKAAFTSAF